MTEKTKARITHALQIALAVTGGVLAIGDKVKALPLPGNLTQYWGVFLAFAISAKPVIMLAGDIFDDGELNNSFTFPPIPPAPEPPAK